jgi:hypothetical protein
MLQGRGASFCRAERVWGWAHDQASGRFEQVWAVGLPFCWQTANYDQLVGLWFAPVAVGT